MSRQLYDGKYIDKDGNLQSINFDPVEIQVPRVYYDRQPLLVKRLRSNATLPTKAYENDAGYDLYTLDDVIFKPGVITPISTGIAVAIPPGYVGLFWDKSSFGEVGIKIFGGVIDSGYRGELKLKMGLMNTFERGWINVPKGAKIAQMLIQKVEDMPVVEVEELPLSERGTRGFGSSGK